MKTIFFGAILSAVVSLQDVFAGWEQVASLTTTQLNRVFFASSQVGYIVGNEGVLLKSNDSGKAWNPILTGHMESFGGVVFLDENIGFITGGDGLILRTTDAGATWEKVQTPDTSTMLTDINFVTPNKGFAVGQNGQIWKSEDAGSTWQIASSSAFQPSGRVHPKFCFPNPDTAYVATGDLNAILRSTNGGISWLAVNPGQLIPGFATFLSGCHFFNGTQGFFVGSYYGDIIKTEDGLNSLVKKGLTNSYDIHFPTTQIGYSVGYDGRSGASVFKSTNGGDTWSSQVVPDVGRLFSVFFLSANYGIAVGEDGTILRTTDGGGGPVGIPPPKRESSPLIPRFRSPLGRFFDALGRSVLQVHFLGYKYGSFFSTPTMASP